MNPQNVMEGFSELPPKAQRQVADFINLLKINHASSRAIKHVEKERGPMVKSPFVGMWKDRKDMQDSSHWVRELRTKEWG